MTASKQSFGAQQHGHGNSPSGKTFWYSVLAVLGCFLLFILVVAVAYIPPNEVNSTGQPEVVQARFGRLEEMRAKEATAATEYVWVDKGKGVVRIPIERAVQLVPERLNARSLQGAPAAPSADAAVGSGPATIPSAETSATTSSAASSAASSTSAPAADAASAANQPQAASATTPAAEAAAEGSAPVGASAGAAAPAETSASAAAE